MPFPRARKYDIYIHIDVQIITQNTYKLYIKKKKRKMIVVHTYTCIQ